MIGARVLSDTKTRVLAVRSLDRWIKFALVALPLVYVDNPVSRVAGFTDDSPWSYVPVALLTAAACGYAAFALTTGHVRRPPHPLDGPLIGLAIVIVASGALGLALRNPRLYVLDDLFQMLEFCAFYFAISTLIDRDMVAPLLQLVLALTLLCALTDFVVAFHSWNRAVDGFPRVFPDGIRALPALILPIVLSLVLTSGKRQNTILVASLLILGLWTVASLTRGLWLADAAAVVVLVFAAGAHEGRLRVARRLGIGVAVVAVLTVPILVAAQLAAPHLLDYLKFRIVYTPQQILDPANRIQARRVLELFYVAADLMRSPFTLIFGKGLGATYLGDTGYSAATLTFGPRHFIHDSYLAFWFRIGIPGLLAYLFLGWRFIREGLKASRATEQEARALVLGMVAAYVAVLVFSITSDSLLRHPTGIFIAAAMVIAMRVGAAQRDKTTHAPVARAHPEPVRLAVTIISNSHRDLLARCLRSVDESLARAGCAGQTVVLDNASRDDSADMVAADFPAVRLIRRRTPQGFSANQNKLFEATRTDSELVLLLNDDVILEPDTIRSLAAAIETDASVAAVGPTLTYPDGSYQTAGERLPDLAYHLARHLGIGRLVPAQLRALAGRRRAPSEAADSALLDAGYISAACMLISVQALDSVGSFDEGFTMYSEDADWCKRAEAAGWRICVEPSINAVHYRNQSWNAATAVERERSMYRYLRKHGAGRVEIAFLRGVVLGIYLVRLLLVQLSLRLGLKRRDVRALDRLTTYRGIVAVSLGS